MSFTEKYTKAFRTLLPAPFTIAIVLTIVTYLLSLSFGNKLPKAEASVFQASGNAIFISKSEQTKWSYKYRGGVFESAGDTLIIGNTGFVENVKASMSEKGNSYETNIVFAKNNDGA